MSAKLRIIALLLIMAFAFCSCSRSAAFSVGVFDGDAYRPESRDGSFATCSPDALTSYASSERITLLCDTRTGAPVVSDVSGAASLCSISDTALARDLSYVMSVTVINRDGKRYIFNTGDNSARFGSFTVEQAKDGYSVTYALSDKKEDALCSREVLAADAVRVDITLGFSLDGDVLRAAADLSEAFVSNGCFIESITLLPGFSVSGGGEGEFFVLPDGSGALADLTYVPQSDLAADILVYGNDVSTGDAQSRIKAYAPVFGARLGGMFYSAVAQYGDAQLNLRFVRTAGTAGGAIIPVFTVTASQLDGRREYFGTSYTGKIGFAYSFSDARDGSYSMVAVAARELFERNGVLNVNTEATDGDIPFFLTVVGSASDGKRRIFTKYGEAREILEILKAKGVNRVLLRYSGALTGGLSGGDARNVALNSALDGKNAFGELCDYAAAQGVKVYLDANLLLRGGSGTLKTLSGSNAVGVPVSSVPKAFEAQSGNLGLARAAQISRGADNVLDLIYTTGCSGVSLNDAASYLYSDASSGAARQDTAAALGESVRAFCVAGDVVLDEPAAYLMRYASYADAMPLTATLGIEPGITSVPLLQMIFHGYVRYSCGSLNSYGSFETAALKCAEYGSIPSAMLTYSSSRLDYETCYTVLANDIARFYTKLCSVTGDLGTEKIISHRLVAEGVYCTEYGNSAKVYVNYTYEDIIINGITLSARDFIRVG